MDINLLLKPMLLLSGIKDLRIRFDPDERMVIATGTQNGQAFEYSQSFEDLEALINGPDCTTQDREAGGVLPDSRAGGDRPT